MNFALLLIFLIFFQYTARWRSFILGRCVTSIVFLPPLSSICMYLITVVCIVCYFATLIPASWTISVHIYNNTATVCQQPPIAAAIAVSSPFCYCRLAPTTHHEAVVILAIRKLGRTRYSTSRLGIARLARWISDTRRVPCIDLDTDAETDK